MNKVTTITWEKILHEIKTNERLFMVLLNSVTASPEELDRINAYIKDLRNIEG
jgi:hypothetical protein